MELDTFLTSPRWDILRILIEKPSSPTEIAEQLHTTISFVSQQLKLLEAANIVKKERTGNVDKGKPRTLFSLSKETLYLVPLARGFLHKKMVPLTREKGIILNIWNVEEHKLHAPLEKFFWNIQEHLDDLEGIYLSLKGLTPKIFLLTKKTTLTSQLNTTQKKNEESLPFEIVTTVSTLAKNDSALLIPLYDPHRFFMGGTKMKGGKEEDE